jgi:hypothetical protein
MFEIKVQEQNNHFINKIKKVMIQKIRNFNNMLL